ncbi:MAG: GAF domain-containing protein [Anaerolineales bacterium]|uniref:ATP-binding protein n=1 Tax=Promineifilum sp. TaxID=2664178 RepID=UPI001DBEEBF8|nr:GAF domain-containing protein [Anaerolineales bacterium]MCB8935765.1 GAF domain-containing protein [Promineifilum sp.]MCO5179566.1 ATP-binding protein [Promineifilum sp.]
MPLPAWWPISINAGMIVDVQPQQSHDIQGLWQDVVNDLRDVFDVHFVCARFSHHIARYTAARTLIAVADTESKCYDLWLANPNGHTFQHRWTQDEAGFDVLMDYTHPVYLDKLERPAIEVISSRLWLETKNRLMVVGLTQAARANNTFPPVILALIDPSESRPVQPHTLQQIVDLMFVFLDRAALRQEVDRRTIEFAVISDVSRALSSTLNVEQIYQLLTGPVRQTLNVETLSIGLVEPITGDIIFVGTLFGPEFERLPPIRLSRGQGIAGWVAEHQEPVIINNTYSDQRFFSGVDRRSGFRTSSMICIPLKVDDRTIGVLQAINRQFGKFTNHDLELMQGLGGPLAAAIENANLHADVLAEKRRIETLFSSMSEGLVTVNREGIITKANSAFSTLMAGQFDKIVGAPLRELVRLEKGVIDSLIGRILDSTEANVHLAADISQPEGRSLPILISGAPVDNEHRAANEAILVFSDLTQIREVERMRDDLFQGIVHELRTPLATILMYSRLLREGKARDPEKSERFLGVIERESDRLQRMIRQMLDLAKLEAREMRRSPEPVWLNPVFDEALPPLVDRAVQKGLLFRQRIETDLPPVMGNSEVYDMTLKNLLDNAIKFTPSGSIQLAAWQDNGTVIIEVTDEGIGIPPEAMNNLFKRFYRAQSAVERGIAGTGLGLYMVKENLKNYNGHIAVQSTLGKGSTFTIHLPVAQL